MELRHQIFSQDILQYGGLPPNYVLVAKGAVRLVANGAVIQKTEAVIF